MELETPFVASDFVNWRRSVGGAPAGLFVDPQDVDDTAREITKLVEDDERLRAMATAGRRHILERFNWSAVARPLEARLLEIAHDGSTPALYAEQPANRI
jgi:glycosyltransferase involved in cell wall biosynthesis